MKSRDEIENQINRPAERAKKVRKKISAKNAPEVTTAESKVLGGPDFDTGSHTAVNAVHRADADTDSNIDPDIDGDIKTSELLVGGAGQGANATVIDLESGLTAEEIKQAMDSEFGKASSTAPFLASSDGVVIAPFGETLSHALTHKEDEFASEGDDSLAVQGSQQELGLEMNESMGAPIGEPLAELKGESPVGEVAFIEEMLPNELSHVQTKSIIESILFASHHPVSFASLKAVFSGTNISSETLWDILNLLQTDYAGGERGINLEEVAGGYQLRTKLDNAGWLKKLVKARPFKLSGPALEVLSIVAYKQPVIKSEIDDIRGVESGHLVRALMEKHLVRFSGKSELPGKPMLYATTKNFLELFGLRNIRELPTLSEIDKLIPEGIGEGTDIGEKETLSSLSDKIAIEPGKSYSESESELLSITDAITEISTTTAFFEQEKLRERDRRDQERAQDLRERKIIGETLNDVDAKWLIRFETKIEQIAAAAIAQTQAAEQAQADVRAVVGADEGAASASTGASAEDKTENAVTDSFSVTDAADGTEVDAEATTETLPVSESDEGFMDNPFSASDLEIEAAEAADGEVAASEVGLQDKIAATTSSGAETDSEANMAKDHSAARVSAATKAAEEGLAAFMDDDDTGSTNH